MPHRGPFGIIINPNRKAAFHWARRIAEILIERGQPVPLLEPETAEELGDLSVEFVSREEMTEACSLMVTLGGDGTLLRAARLAAPKSIPIWALNTGTLGFLTEGCPEHIERMIDDLLSGRYAIDDRMMLQVDHVRSENTILKTGYVLNDVVFSFRGASRMRSVDVWVDDDFLTTYEADGVIISTPTGSTAYSLSAGGPIVEPGLNAVIVNPICPHALTNRPLVLEGSKTITIRPHGGEGTPCVTLDGQQECVIKSEGEKIVIQRAPVVTRLVRTSAVSYYEMLREKLNWGGGKGVNGQKKRDG